MKTKMHENSHKRSGKANGRKVVKLQLNEEIGMDGKERGIENIDSDKM